jgi:uncharacterized protein DUF4389
MTSHPVHLHVEPARVSRVGVVIRIALLLGLATIGYSSIYWALYLMLPAVAALLVTRGAPEYLEHDSPSIVRVLRWLAGAYAYVWLLTDALPTTEPGGPVELEIEVGGKPTVNSALSRLVTSLPALLVLVLLSVVSGVLWIVGALFALATERVPTAITDLLAMKVRYQFRLAAYHLSLVDAYPVLADLPLGHEPRSV